MVYSNVTAEVRFVPQDLLSEFRLGVKVFGRKTWPKKVEKFDWLGAELMMYVSKALCRRCEALEGNPPPDEDRLATANKLLVTGCKPEASRMGGRVTRGRLDV